MPDEMIVAWQQDGVETALSRISQAQQAGKWLAGFASYELGYVLIPGLADLIPTRRDTPLLAFGVFDGPEARAPIGGQGSLQALLPHWSATRYAHAFARLHDYIGAGDVYQANLTFPLSARYNGGPEGLYAALAATQPVDHAALADLGAGPVILSRSPELFFATDAQGRITTRPMKGTAPRGDTPVQDQAHRNALQRSEKDRAENLMIVDLLRNDVSRIAQVGSVEVPKLFDVETYATVHQMVSEVTAELLPGTDLPAILRALFPCGSITGAPKRRAMEIIRELEPDPRGIYCGTLGWMGPDGASCFNVAIRTLSLFDGGAARLNAGGGVVWDSTAAREYEEALWKTRFARTSPQG
ncbi:aminodeoxychorismate synthase component I [Actibacterium mucosum]|nr:aminodeoxychorismate synthase component I [Actibacterium mucosum]